jgi:hypothetical protein
MVCRAEARAFCNAFVSGAASPPTSARIAFATVAAARRGLSRLNKSISFASLPITMRYAFASTPRSICATAFSTEVVRGGAIFPSAATAGMATPEFARMLVSM